MPMDSPTVVKRLEGTDRKEKKNKADYKSIGDDMLKNLLAVVMYVDLIFHRSFQYN